MKIALAQIQSISGNISENIKKHLVFIEEATRLGTDIIVFPELSITNYEPTLAEELATVKTDNRFDIFQETSNTNNIVIGIGAPVKCNENSTISMLIFQPKKEVLNYAKQVLHEDELPYFVCGEQQVYITLKSKKIGFAICYESMQEVHFLNTCNNNIDIYLTSVAKTDEGVESALLHYQSISEKQKKTVVMVNAVGKSDDFVNAGQSSVVKNGKIIKQLNKTEEGILVYDF